MVMRIRGWIAQITTTTPAMSKLTGVALPGICEPRSKALSGDADMMLCGTVSSFRKTTGSPRATVNVATEKARPFWRTTLSDAPATVDSRIRAAICIRQAVRMGAPWPTISARQDGNDTRCVRARQRHQERDEVRLFRRRQVERCDQLRFAGPVHATTIVMDHDGRERRQRSVVHIRRAARDFAQARRLE